MFAIRLLEIDGNNFINTIAIGVGYFAKKAQLAHLRDRNYKYDYGIQLQNDGIFFVDMDLSSMPLEFNIQNSVLSQSFQQISNIDNFLPLYDNNTGRLNYTEYLLIPYKLSTSSIFNAFTNTALSSESYNGNNTSNAPKALLIKSRSGYTSYNTYEPKRLYLGNNLIQSGISSAVKWFFFYVNQNVGVGPQFHFTLYIPSTAVLLEIAAYTAYTVQGSQNNLVTELRASYTIKWDTSETYVNPDDPDNVCEYRYTHVHVIYSQSGFTVKQVPCFGTYPLHKNIDEHARPFVAPGHTAMFRDDEKRIIHNISNLYRIISDLPSVSGRPVPGRPVP